MNHIRNRSKRRRSLESLETRLLLAGDVLINEFMASNSGTLRDSEGDSSDWIELHNSGTDVVDLKGWYLSDDADDLTKWKLPTHEINAGAYLVVFASGKDLTSVPELHTSFRLRAKGEYLSLTKPDGTTVVSSYSPAFPPQQPDVSYGFGEQSRIGYLTKPTPGAENSALRLSETVTFSHTRPTFVDPFLLTLGGAGPTQSIVYTLNGTVPTFESPIYGEPLSIERTMQVRARVVQQNAMSSVATQGYSRLSAEVAEFASRLPIMLIENFGAGPIPNKGFPDQTGADTFQQPWQPAAVTLFEPGLDASSDLNSAAEAHQRIGIRVRGAFSATFDEPGYAMEFWDESDADADVAPLGLTSHSDWVLYAPNPETDITLIDNTFLFSISNEMGHWAPAFQHVETFVNTGGDDVTLSDHVGLYVFEDKVSRGAGRIDFERLSPDGSNGGWLLTVNRMDAIPEDDINATPQHFHTAGPDGILQTLPNSSGVGDDIPRQYNAFLNFEDPNGYRINRTQRESIEAWFVETENVLYGRTETRWNDPDNGYAKYIDVDSFIDYFILNNLSNNGDGFLLSMWIYNPNPQGDGKLTMGPIWDADLGSFQGNPLSRLRRDINRLWYTRMFEDHDFVQQYVDRWFELRRDTLSLQHLTDVIDDLMNQITLEAAERDGVTDWPARLDAMKSWLSRRVPAIDQLFVQPVELQAVATGFKVSAKGDVYYNLDGSDPRQSGGDPSESAVRLTGDALMLDSVFSGTITTRAFLNGRWSAPTRATVPAQLEGDVNADGQLDTADIDFLLAAVAQGTVEPELDVNEDAIVDKADVDYLVDSVFRTQAGDTNLDGRVDFADFLRLSSNFGKVASWSGGNFDTDPVVDFSDFLILASNFGFQRPLDNSVPT